MDKQEDDQVKQDEKAGHEIPSMTMTTRMQVRFYLDNARDAQIVYQMTFVQQKKNENGSNDEEEESNGNMSAANNHPAPPNTTTRFPTRGTFSVEHPDASRHQQQHHGSHNNNDSIPQLDNEDVIFVPSAFPAQESADGSYSSGLVHASPMEEPPQLLQPKMSNNATAG